MKYFNIVSVVILFLLFGFNTYKDYTRGPDVPEVTREQLQGLAEGTGATKARAFYGVQGEATGDLDAVDAANVADKDIGFVVSLTDGLLVYTLDDDSGASESIPDVVTPSGTAGNKRWILVGRSSDTGDYEEVQMAVDEWTTDVETGNGAFYFHIGERLDGMNLVYCHAEDITVATGTGTQTTTIQIHNVTDTADMLSTELTIDEDENGSDTAATAYVINTATDDVAENDVIRIDIDAVPGTTPGKGLIVTLGFENPDPT